MSDVFEALCALSHDRVHPSQEAWTTRNYTQKDVWRSMLRDVVTMVVLDPTTWLKAVPSGTPAARPAPDTGVHEDVPKSSGDIERLCTVLEQAVEVGAEDKLRFESLFEGVLKMQETTNTLLTKIVENTRRSPIPVSGPTSGMPRLVGM